MADILNPPVSSEFFLCRRDPRGKLLILFIFPVFAFQLSLLPLLVFPPLLLTGIIRTELKPLPLLKASLGFIIIIIILPATAVFQIVTGSEVTLLASAVKFSLLLLNIYLAGILIIRSTGLKEIQYSVSWFLSFFPFVPARRIGLLIGLTFSMLPRILDEWSIIRSAQRTRSADSIRNPFKKAAAPLFPLLLNTIFKAETTASALEARGWKDHERFSGREVRMLQKLQWRKKDSLLVISTLLWLVIFLLI